MPAAFPARLVVLLAAMGSSITVAQEKTKTPAPAIPTENNPKAGHSYHGESFNEGPRQAAYLMAGMGKIRFDVSTKDPRTQAFFLQGVCQLHSFWYFEAERSFRQAAFHDPNCAMAYWGMAMANVNNEKRSRDFIAKAEKFRTTATRREQMWIDGWAAQVRSSSTPAVRWRQYIRSLEALIHDFPDDLEAKAFLAWALWTGNTKGVPIGSHQAVDSVIGDVLRENPMHPGAHHYRIHLWDGEKGPRALLAAELYGPSSAGIAHAWHMQGHIYSGLQRFADAVYSQEASARVDHAYMMRDRVMPYQIHNFAHNNQWLITDLSHIGRARDAAASAISLIEVPRHPRGNRIEDAGSCARFGRARLLEVLTRFEMWDELIALCATHIDPTNIRDEQVKRLRALGTAHFAKGDAVAGAKVIAELEALRAAPTKGVDTSKLPAAAKQTVDFAKEILPLLQNKCFECHRGARPVSGLRLDSRADILGKASGKPLALVGNSADSKIIHAVSAIVESGAAMPAEGQALTPVEVGLLRAWIDQGLKWDEAAVTGAAGPKDKTELKNPKDKTGKDKSDVKTPKDKTAKGPVGKGGGGGGAGGSITNALAELNGHLAMATGDHKAAFEHFAKAPDMRKEMLSRAYLAAGNKDMAEKTAKQAADAGRNQVYPQANHADILFRCGKTTEAAAALRQLAPQLRDLDSDLPISRRLAQTAKALKLPANWSKVTPPRPVDQHHPKQDTLGPLVWKPVAAPELALPDMENRTVSLADQRGKPVVVLFYLGAGCDHCVEQLNKFAAAIEDFNKAGIAVVSVSVETPAEVKAACEKPNGRKYPFPMLADPTKGAFKRFRVYDDFENQPLHGTFLIDGDGKVRWQDVAFQPFGDPKHLLEEAKRLLKIRG